MIDPSLYSYLTANLSDPVHAVILPQEPIYPCFTYRRTGTDPVYSFDGRNTLKQESYTIDAWGESYSTAREKADEVIALLDDYIGIMGSVRVSGVRAIDEIDIYEDQVLAFRTSITFQFYFVEV